jgi:hypothetical protein
VHLLVSWGLFRRDGSFIPVEGTPEPETVAQLFRHRVLRMLLDEGAIEETVVQNLLAWPHTGFGTHVSRAIPVDEKTPGVVARYMARPPISVRRGPPAPPGELPGVRSRGLSRRGDRPPESAGVGLARPAPGLPQRGHNIISLDTPSRPLVTSPSMSFSPWFFPGSPIGPVARPSW